ncbi:MAG: hypothetical protein GC161_05235 [Planctomycetaceae bacterium]|nr:hypothetical protein [Planctomycetaceae bacterium]
MNPARLVLVLVVLAALVWLATGLFGGKESTDLEPTAADVAFTEFRSSAQCQSCHAEVYEEWSRSQHADSWTGAEVRALSMEFANQDCIDCHAPAPIFQSGIGNRVQPRAVRQVQGVDCIACHVLPGGGVAGTIADERAACRPVVRAELASPEYCAACHNQHGTVDQWRATRFAADGVSCIDCHMPHRGGDPARGRSHVSPGGSDIELVRSAIELRGGPDGDGWYVEVENVGVGHAFPTDERSRAADLFWRPLVAEGEAPVAWQHLHRFRDPYRPEVDLPRTLLDAHEVRRVPVLSGPSDPHRHIAAPVGDPVRGPIEVALFYKRSPYYDDPAAPDPEREAWLVHRIELRP